MGVGDFNGTEHVGDENLALVLKRRVHPSLNIFGHIHGAWKEGVVGQTRCINVSSYDGKWAAREPLALSVAAKEVGSLGVG
jgi:Icc-related predicted phosphoesterase